MKYGKLLDTLQNLIGFRPKQSELCNILGVKTAAMSARAARDSAFTDAEIAKVEEYYGVDLTNDCVELEYISIKPSCGRGTVVRSDADVTPVKIGREIIRDLWKVPDPSDLKLFRASGDSMESIIEDGNILLVDTSRRDFNNGGIFVLRINNEWYVKRLRLRVTGELDIISDNTKYPVETLKPDCDVEIIIIGRVIKNLSRGL